MKELTFNKVTVLQSVTLQMINSFTFFFFFEFDKIHFKEEKKISQSIFYKHQAFNWF